MTEHLERHRDHYGEGQCGTEIIVGVPTVDEM